MYAENGYPGTKVEPIQGENTVMGNYIDQWEQPRGTSWVHPLRESNEMPMGTMSLPAWVRTTATEHESCERLTEFGQKEDSTAYLMFCISSAFGLALELNRDTRRARLRTTGSKTSATTIDNVAPTLPRTGGRGCRRRHVIVQPVQLVLLAIFADGRVFVKHGRSDEPRVEAAQALFAAGDHEIQRVQRSHRPALVEACLE